jgi:hypothetical protein
MFCRCVSSMSTANDVVLNSITDINVLHIVLVAAQVSRDFVLPQVWECVRLKMLGWPVLRNGKDRIVPTNNEEVSRARSQGARYEIKLRLRCREIGWPWQVPAINWVDVVIVPLTIPSQGRSVDHYELNGRTIRSCFRKVIPEAWEVPALTLGTIIDLGLNIPTVIMVACDQMKLEAGACLQVAPCETFLEGVLKARVRHAFDT